MNETDQPNGQLTSWLIEPAASIQEPERRRQARLLLSLLLAIILISILSVTIDIITGQLVLQTLDDYLPVMGIVALIGVYGLSRTRYYAASAIVFIGVLFAVVHTAPILEPDSPGWLYYAVLPILLSGIFFSLPVLLAVAAASIGSMLLLIGFVPGIEFDLYWLPIMYTAVITMVIVTFIRHRDLVEMDRQDELKRANVAIQESEAKWRSLVEHAPATIFYVTRDGTVEFTNYLPA
jgi:PAS domain-containing protein